MNCERQPKNAKPRGSSIGAGAHVWRVACLATTLSAMAGGGVFGQVNTRLLVASGMGVPSHAGFVFGPLSNLAMNDSKDVVFLTSLRSARIELAAVARSEGVTFSIVAFQGLRSPVPRATYESFSAPSINTAGSVAFTARIKMEKGNEEVEGSAVILVRKGIAQAVAVSGDPVPGDSRTAYQDFSAPLVNSAGNVLFGARVVGKLPGFVLFLWTPQRTRTLEVPAQLGLAPTDLLQPIYFGHDEAVLALAGAAPDNALEQFFRAIAVKSFQDLNPPPKPTEAFELLPARAGASPAKLLVVLMEDEIVQSVPLVGDATQPVMAKAQGGAPLRPLTRILGQTGGAGGNSIFAATAAGQELDLGFYCLCDGQVARLTAPEEFLTILERSRPLSMASFSGDSQHTVAFILPSGTTPDSTAIYVTSLP